MGTPLGQGVPAPGGVAAPWQARHHGVRDSGDPGSDRVQRSTVRTVNPTDTTVLHGHRESDRARVPTKRPTTGSQKRCRTSRPRQPRRRSGREGHWPRATRASPTGSGPSAGQPWHGRWTGTPGSQGERETVDGAGASGRLHRPPAGGVVQAQSCGSAGGGWPDRGHLRGATCIPPAGARRALAAGSLPGPTGGARLQPESGWAPAPQGPADAGRHNRPAGARRGAHRHLRARVARVLVRCPPRPQPAPRGGGGPR